METKFDKTLEILFELKVRDVMKKDTVTLNKDAMMSDLMSALRKHNISGVPVVEEEDHLVGIISIEDLIKWLGSKEDDVPVRQRMVRDPQCLYGNQPLVHAVKRFDQEGFGRFPVLDGEKGKLIGIITKGDIIEGTLKKLEKEYKEEEIRQYRASHFFQDILADSRNITLSFEIIGKDFDRAGKASTTMKKNLKRLGIRPDIIQRVAIASYEAEMNTVLYTDGGTMIFSIAEDNISLTIEDSGPGIENIDLAMQEGYTTSAQWVKDLGFGAGMGLPNIKKCADELDVKSTVGKGTKIHLIIYSENSDEP